MGERAALVVDNGSGFIRAGTAGDDVPGVMFQTILGRPKFKGVILGQRDYYVGNEAQSRRATLVLKYPIEKGIVTNWDDMEAIWNHTFYRELKVVPQDYCVLLTESPMNPKSNREKMTQVMFETFNTPAILIEISALLALYASGRTTGLVVDVGAGATHAVPFTANGAMAIGAVQEVDVAGRDLTNYLMKLLTESGYPFTTPADREIAEDIKKKLCFLPAKPPRSLVIPNSSILGRLPGELLGRVEAFAFSECRTRTYELPDGQHISVRTELYGCPEALFNPELIGSPCPGIHLAVQAAIGKCPSEAGALWSDVLLTGGSTLFPGFVDRMRWELTALAGPETKVRVIPPERRNGAWLGGSIMASLPAFRDRWFTKQDYDEAGPSMRHSRKCF